LHEQEELISSPSEWGQGFSLIFSGVPIIVVAMVSAILSPYIVVVKVSGIEYRGVEVSEYWGAL
jgi:hypothetical protein